MVLQKLIDTFQKQHASHHMDAFIWHDYLANKRPCWMCMLYVKCKYISQFPMLRVESANHNFLLFFFSSFDWFIFGNCSRLHRISHQRCETWNQQAKEKYKKKDMLSEWWSSFWLSKMTWLYLKYRVTRNIFLYFCFSAPLGKQHFFSFHFILKLWFRSCLMSWARFDIHTSLPTLFMYTFWFSFPSLEWIFYHHRLITTSLFRNMNMMCFFL